MTTATVIPFTTPQTPSDVPRNTLIDGVHAYTRTHEEGTTVNKPVIRQKSAAWTAGYKAVFAGKPKYPVPAGMDELSYVSGWIEGKSDLKLVREIRRLSPEARKNICDLIKLFQKI
jgi:hypothetical protein